MYLCARVAAGWAAVQVIGVLFIHGAVTSGGIESAISKQGRY